MNTSFTSPKWFGILSCFILFLKFSLHFIIKLWQNYGGTYSHIILLFIQTLSNRPPYNLTEGPKILLNIFFSIFKPFQILVNLHSLYKAMAKLCSNRFVSRFLSLIESFKQTTFFYSNQIYHHTFSCSFFLHAEIIILIGSLPKYTVTYFYLVSVFVWTLLPISTHYAEQQ